MIRTLARFAFVVALLAPAMASATPPPPPIYAPPQMPRTYPPLDDGRIRIFFDFRSAALSSIAEEIVDKAAAAWALCPGERVVIAGHTDEAERGRRAVGLSRRRGEAVRTGLIARGGDPAKISVEAHGSSRPALAVTPRPREPFNRRIEIAIPCLLRSPKR